MAAIPYRRRASRSATDRTIVSLAEHFARAEDFLPERWARDE